MEDLVKLYGAILDGTVGKEFLSDMRALGELVVNLESRIETIEKWARELSGSLKELERLARRCAPPATLSEVAILTERVNALQRLFLERQVGSSQN